MNGEPIPSAPPSPAEALPFLAGLVEHECRTAIRDMIRLHGFDAARELVAQILNDEADGRRS